MAAGVTLKHKRKTSAFAGGELAAGEWGLNTNNGQWYFSVDGTTVTALPGAGTSSNPTLITAEISVGASVERSGKFNITSSGLAVGKGVIIQQAHAPYTGKGTRSDEAEMDSLVVSAKVTSATNIECFWSSRYKVRGNFKFNYFISS